MKCIYLLPVICICFLFSCESNTNEKKFFDVPAFFKNEIALIEKENYVITKAYAYNYQGSKMDVKASDIKWENEFAIFLESDINKPAYFANMEVINASYDPLESNTLYKSKSKKLNIQSVKVTSCGGEVKDISIHINKSNLISNTTIDAYYSKGIRYSIIGTQNINQFNEKNVFWVEGRFYK